MCLAGKIVVFFYGYVYEGYYDSNVDSCFTYLSGYEDNASVRSSLPTLYLVSSLHFLDIKTQIMRIYEKGEDI